MVANAVLMRRPDLQLRQLSAGQYVAKDPRNGSYFHLGEQEHFLLQQFNGDTSSEAIQQAYEAEFGEALLEEDLLGFIKVAQRDGLLEHRTLDQDPSAPAEPAPAAGRQSLLYWRKTLFDPDRLLSWLTPRLAFFWSNTCFALTGAVIILALYVAGSNAHELARQVSHSTGWGALLFVWVLLIGITTVHEFGHGLTCKRHGGEVHEMGLLMMYFLPCLFCNVSDAWLISDKRKRLWVTAAGGYVELCVWALAVLVWRVTVTDAFVNYLALSIITVSGFRILFNLTPFLKLDGYYLLSDALEIPNLRPQALEYTSGHLRWLLWGAPRPTKLPRGKVLIAYGFACWIASLITTAMMVNFFGAFLYSVLGVVGIGLALGLAVLALRGLFAGLTRGEVRQMLLTRHKRLAVVFSLLVTAVVALCVIPMENRAHGTFEVRPMTRHEVRAPIAGFLKEVHVKEGQKVSPTEIAVRLEVPDLESRIARKNAEVREAEAALRLLEEGTREEKITEQKQRIQRVTELRDLSLKTLDQAKLALKQELLRLDQKIEQRVAELGQAKANLERSAKLYKERVISTQLFEEESKRVEVAEAVLKQATAEKETREAVAVGEPQQELALIDKQLLDEEGALKLLQAGARAEEVEAEEAHLARLREELKFLQEVETKLPVFCGHQGVVVTPHVEEMVGQYLNEGDLICVVEELETLSIEIRMPEDELNHVANGQRVKLKARALPFETFETNVERIAPSASEGDVQSSVVIHAHLAHSPDLLKPGMTGYARIECGPQPVGKILLDRALRYVRTEFWW